MTVESKLKRIFGRSKTNTPAASAVNTPANSGHTTPARVNSNVSQTKPQRTQSAAQLGVKNTNPFTLGKRIANETVHVMPQQQAPAPEMAAGFYLNDGDANDGSTFKHVDNPNDHLPEEHKVPIPLFAQGYKLASTSNLGNGASSTVLKVSDLKGQHTYALKKFVTFRNEKEQNFYKRCIKEYLVAKKLSGNLHIAETVTLVKVQQDGSSFARSWGMILELCDSDLFKLMERPGWRDVDHGIKDCWFKQIADGLRWMHSLNVAHRDLKAENVLIKNGTAKLTDFGVSIEYEMEEEDVVKIRGEVGSSPYNSPDVLENKWYDPRLMDSWGLGVLLFCMYQQHYPFPDCQGSKYKDFVSVYEHYASRHPSFRENDCKKAPVDSSFASGGLRHQHGACRVAFRLCDPKSSKRMTLEQLAHDPWFLAIDVCHEEDLADVEDEPERHESPPVKSMIGDSGLESGSSSASLRSVGGGVKKIGKLVKHNHNVANTSNYGSFNRR